MKKIPRLVLVGDVGGMETYHVGDEAMLCANIDRLRQLPRPPSCTVVSSDPQWTSRRYGVQAIPLIGFPGRQEAHPARLSESVPVASLRSTTGYRLAAPPARPPVIWKWPTSRKWLPGRGQRFRIEKKWYQKK